MSEPFIGEIRILPYNFAPRGWAACDGQLLPISQNTALFSLLGTAYGGDGRTTFGLPNLPGRTILHAGQGPGLSQRRLGHRGGERTVTLTTAAMANHTHPLQGSASRADTPTPAAAVPARTVGATPYASGASLDTTLAGTAVADTGQAAPHNNMQPYLVLQYCIALVGIYPPRGDS